MKKLITSVLKFTIDKVKRNRFIQNIFESPFDLEKFDNLGNYKDSYGNVHKLYNGLRTKIRPGWERMLTNTKPDSSSVNVEKVKSNSLITIEKLETSLNSFGKTIKGSNILEIGCHSGSVSFAMAEKGAKKVVGTEFNGYKVSSIDQGSSEDSSKLNEVNDYLKTLRNKLREVYTIENDVEFFDDDICKSKLAQNSFDIICSWEVLEHLHDPKAAFESISKLLNKGGISIHHYNPFFCLNGGHSLCTLDFLWGHVRLNENDFVDYINTLRPKEIDRAVSFYKNGVNRMTLSDLDDILEDTEMKVLGVIPFTKEQHLRMVDEQTLQQVMQNYPNTTIMDLATPAVLVISQKQN